MKRLYRPVFCLLVILAVLAHPVSAAPNNNIPAQETVSASAVVVPAQVSRLGFVISGMATDVPVKEGDTVAAGQTLMVLDTPDLEFAITEAQAGLRAAEAQAEIRSNEIIKKIRINYVTFTIKKLRLSVPHEVIEMEDAKVQKAQALMEFAQAKLTEGTLIAPHDGTIASLEIIPGEFVQADQAVITLATMNNLQLETTDLSERDILNVHIGDIADVFIEALNQTIQGKVIRIAPMADTVSGDVVFKVTIALDEQPEELLWGMTAVVTIQGAE